MFALNRCRKFVCFTEFILQFLILQKCTKFTLTNTITTAATTTKTLMVEHNNVHHIKANSTTLRHIGRTLNQCLAISEGWVDCMEHQLAEIIDSMTLDNSTWRYGNYIIAEKLKNNRSTENNHGQSYFAGQKQQRSTHAASGYSNGITDSLLRLAQARSIRLRFPPSSVQTLKKLSTGISDAIDGLSLEDIVQPPNTLVGTVEEGRKKKNKGKNGAMLGGIALAAMVAQMYLSKVLLIAGAAFIMAKIALLVSVIGSLKKDSSGGSTSTDHIIVADHGYGGHGGHNYHHSAGWHRSMPHVYNNKQVIKVVPEFHEEHYHKPPQLLNIPTTGYENHDYNKYEVIESGQNVHGDDEDYRRRQMQGVFIRK